MRSPIMAIVLSLALSGCVSSHDFYFVGRQTGATGTASVPADGHRGGPIEVALAGKTYRGRWAYIETGGGVGMAFSGSQSAVAVGLPIGGNGTVLATASDGSTLRCTFDFSEINLRGIGVCRDNRGETYDLQIS